MWDLIRNNQSQKGASLHLGPLSYFQGYPNNLESYRKFSQPQFFCRRLLVCRARPASKLILGLCVIFVCVCVWSKAGHFCKGNVLTLLTYMFLHSKQQKTYQWTLWTQEMTPIAQVEKIFFFLATFDKREKLSAKFCKVRLHQALKK